MFFCFTILEVNGICFLKKKLYISDLQKRRLRHVKIWDDHKSSIRFDDWKSSPLYFEIKKIFSKENEGLGLGNSVYSKLTEEAIQ